jgi:hypothetical protein
MLLLTVATLLAGPHPRSAALRDPGEVKVTVDSARHTLTISAGPFALPGAVPTTGPVDHHTMHQGSEVPMMLFKWPVAGWTRGFELRLTDGQGRPLNRRLLHHLNVVNFGRRQLFYSIPERMLAAGQETPDILLPKTVGIPVEAGMPMGLIVAWHNEKPEPVPEIYVTLVMHWTPTNIVPRPASVLPVYFDVQNPVGRSVAFDLPAGRTTFTADLTVPAGGRIVGIGGHGHDFMTNLALEEVTGTRTRIVSRLRTPLDSAGRLISVEQKLPGIRGNGIPLRRGSTYRIVGSYDNPTGAMIPDGAMVHIILLYAVDDLRQWPKLDPDDPDWRTDLDYLDAMNTGGEGEAHEHGGEHQH